jgi:hypothetical protein
VISVLGHDHVSQQTRASQATRNRATGRFRLHDRIALAAAEFRAYVPDDFETGRNPFEHSATSSPSLFLTVNRRPGSLIRRVYEFLLRAEDDQAGCGGLVSV